MNAEGQETTTDWVAHAKRQLGVGWTMQEVISMTNIYDPWLMLNFPAEAMETE